MKCTSRILYARSRVSIREIVSRPSETTGEGEPHQRRFIVKAVIGYLPGGINV